MNKYCKHCETIKPNSEFPKARSVCRSCFKKQTHDIYTLYYMDHKDEYKIRNLKNKILKQELNDSIHHQYSQQPSLQVS